MEINEKCRRNFSNTDKIFVKNKIMKKRISEIISSDKIQIANTELKDFDKDIFNKNQIKNIEENNKDMILKPNEKLDCFQNNSFKFISHKIIDDEFYKFLSNENNQDKYGDSIKMKKISIVIRLNQLEFESFMQTKNLLSNQTIIENK